MSAQGFIKRIVVISLVGVFIVGVAGIVLFVWLWKMGPEDLREYLEVDRSKCLLGKDGTRLWVGLNKSHQWCIPVAIDEVSPYMVSATVAVEDKRFWRHKGVDLIAVCRALLHNIFCGKVVSGASTITMQVVKAYHKNCSDWRLDSFQGRVFFKLFQIVQAVRLEASVSKKEILQTYLNKVSYGSNLMGVMSASWRYFGKDARFLNLEESAILAGIPKLPEFFRPDRNLSNAIVRGKYVLMRMKENSFITEEEYVSAVGKLESISLKMEAFPHSAFYLAQKVFKDRKEGGSVRTTLNAEIQVACEEILKIS